MKNGNPGKENATSRNGFLNEIPREKLTSLPPLRLPPEKRGLPNLNSCSRRPCLPTAAGPRISR